MQRYVHVRGCSAAEIGWATPLTIIRQIVDDYHIFEGGIWFDSTSSELVAMAIDRVLASTCTSNVTSGLAERHLQP